MRRDDPSEPHNFIGHISAEKFGTGVGLQNRGRFDASGFADRSAQDHCVSIDTFERSAPYRNICHYPNDMGWAPWRLASRSLSHAQRFADVPLPIGVCVEDERCN